jgi:hypothetical protein
MNRAMSTPAMGMDSRILKYYLEQLNEAQKRALLSVARAFARKPEVTSEEERPALSADTDRQRKKLIHAERERYLQGEGISYSPEQVRELALNKSGRHVL